MGSTCLLVRVGQGGQRGGGHITCSSANVSSANLTCSAGVVTANLTNNTIPSGVPIGVESGNNFSFGGIFTTTNSSGTQLQWNQQNCSGTSTSALVSTLVHNGVQLDGADGSYYQIHCEFTVDCVLIDSLPQPKQWTTRAVAVTAVTGQSSVGNIVHVGDANRVEDIVLTALQRCIGPDATVDGCATNVLRDDFNSVTLQDASLGWYVIGHQSSGFAPALISSSPSVGWLMPTPQITFRNTLSFVQLGGQTNGTLTFCPDCQVIQPQSCSTANPSACACAAGGSGAFARRINNQWFCN